MNKVIKWVVAVAILMVMAAAISSCSSSRQLGCPMKITMAKAQINWPAC
ncbi:MAG: hypothetical protein ACRDE2_10270 [Chitinophagaceae bacterium]